MTVADVETRRDGERATTAPKVSPLILKKLARDRGEDWEHTQELLAAVAPQLVCCRLHLEVVG